MTTRRPRIDRVLSRALPRVGIDDPPRPIRDLLRDTISDMSYSQIDAEIFSEELTENARIRIIQQINEHVADGRSLIFALNSSNDSYIQGACFVELGVDDDDAARRKRERSTASHILSALSEVSPLDFERLCVVALHQLGAHDLHLTPYTADQGVDFYGRLGFSGILSELIGYPPILNKLRVWVIGQAKHYPSGQAATFDLRELTGSVQLARSSAYAMTGDRYPGLRVRPCDPVFSVFITSGSISRDSWLLCRSSGVIAIDGVALVHILGSSRLGSELGERISGSRLSRLIRQESARLDATVARTA